MATETDLIAEKLSHTIDLLRANINTIRASQEHADELATHRLTSLELQVTDFEKRIRSLQDSSTQFKLLSSLAIGGGLLSLISLIRAIIG